MKKLKNPRIEIIKEYFYDNKISGWKINKKDILSLLNKIKGK